MVTVLLLVLLSLLALGLLSLSAASLRTSAIGNDQATARQNARMALIIAMASIQKSTGPDQRVTASASIFDTEPGSLTIEGVNAPWIVGAWKTTDDDGNPIIRQDGTGITTDIRNPEDANYLDHRNRVETWLSSGAAWQSFDPRTVELDTTPGSARNAVVIGQDSGIPITAPLVKVDDTGDGQHTGAYAFHVKDLGTAMPLLQHNPNVKMDPDPGQGFDGGYSNLYSGRKRDFANLTDIAPAASYFATDDFLEDPSAGAKYVTLGTCEIFGPSGKDEATESFLASRHQSVTATNLALFTDTLGGKLKTDLTPYFRNQSDPGSGSLSKSDGSTVQFDGEDLNDLTPLITANAFRSFSPKFGGLRDYVRLGDYVGEDRIATPRGPLHGGGNNGDFPDPTRVIRQSLHPVMAEYSVYHAIAPNPQSTNTGLALQLYPRVTLWNPYNVTLDTSGYFFQIHHRNGIGIMVNGKRGTHSAPYDQYGEQRVYFGGTPLSTDGTEARQWYFFFFLEATKLEPGQCLVFSPPNGQVTELQNRDGDLSKNVLTAGADIAADDRGCYYIDLAQRRTPIDENASMVPIFDPELTPTQYKFDHKNIRPGQNPWYVGRQFGAMSAYLRIAPDTTSYSNLESAKVLDGQLEVNEYPVIHTINWNGMLNPTGQWWYAGAQPWQQMTSMTPQNNIPENRMKLGARLKGFYETSENFSKHPAAIWNFPLFEGSNLNSSIFRRTPWDSPVESQTKSTFGTKPVIAYGPMTAEEIDQPGYLDPFMLPRYVGGKQESSPFMNTQTYSGNLRFPVLDVPPAGAEIFSPAQFRSAKLTDEFSAPTFILGESLATITAPRDQSAFSPNDYKSLWWAGINETCATTQEDNTWWQSEYDPANSYAAFDYRYETNRVLWDAFFFSTLPKDADLSDYTLPGQLANPGILAVTDSVGDLSDPAAADASISARHLRLRNHLSVNSTDSLAWKSLLSMNRGLQIGDRTTGDSAVPFPGSSDPQGDGNGGFASEAEQTWTGFRQLDEAEIDLLTTELIAEVKRRAPFISLSDFVNRRLYAGGDESADPASQVSDTDLALSYAGPLEIAIRRGGLNASMQDFNLAESTSYTSPAGGAPSPATANFPLERFAGAPGHITQGKILQSIGANLTARSDTFSIRAYGEARDSDGNVTAIAVCQAIIQRTADYVNPDLDEAEVPFDHLTSNQNKAFGRKYRVRTFRWLAQDEIQS